MIQRCGPGQAAGSRALLQGTYREVVTSGVELLPLETNGPSSNVDA